MYAYVQQHVHSIIHSYNTVYILTESATCTRNKHRAPDTVVLTPLGLSSSATVTSLSVLPIDWPAATIHILHNTVTLKALVRYRFLAVESSYPGAHGLTASSPIRK